MLARQIQKGNSLPLYLTWIVARFQKDTEDSINECILCLVLTWSRLKSIVRKSGSDKIDFLRIKSFSQSFPRIPDESTLAIRLCQYAHARSHFEWNHSQ